MACQPASQKAAIGLLETVRRRHHAVLAQRQPCLVAGLVQRRQHVAGEFGGLLEDRLDQIVASLLVAGQGGDFVEAADARMAKSMSRTGAR